MAFKTLFSSSVGILASLLLGPAALADGGITFTDIAAIPGSGLAFSRAGVPSLVAVTEDLHRASLIQPLSFTEITLSPQMPRGLPGVALFDFDNDGDLDIYATNALGHANALFASRLRQTGQPSFVEVAAQAGVAAVDHDSYGVCFGDLDNDGDHDLYVLGRQEPNRLYENRGDGTFRLRAASGAEGGATTGASCSMGDINNDGLLDIVVANAFDQQVSLAIFTEPYALNQHNALFVNEGNLVFSDASASSGITVNGGLPPGAAGISWATTVVDIDLDGDADVIFMDDQGAIPAARSGGLDRGFIHVFLNDGSGHFVDHPIINDDNSASEWMGVTVGDLDCDGHLDLFGSSFGDYDNPAFGAPYRPGSSSSRPLFGHGNGRFTDPYLTWGLTATVFGWGNGLLDYDADGDLDVIFHGGLDPGQQITVRDNPGALLANQGCTGQFAVDTTAITTDHIRRNARAVAVGDLDGNGFEDIVTVADFTLHPEAPLLLAPVSYGSPFDATAFFVPVMKNVGPPEEPLSLWVWQGLEHGQGDLKVELNSGNHHRSVTVDVVGGTGFAQGARVNRDGIGAVLRFTPRRGPTSMQVVSGGASHSSQHALDRVFGLGRERRGTLEVLWPGGVRNRVYGVREGKLTVPEIPCSFNGDFANVREYLRCVRPALHDYREAGILSAREEAHLLASALRAFVEGR